MFYDKYSLISSAFHLQLFILKPWRKRERDGEKVERERE
jgi:hypothetical protein